MNADKIVRWMLGIGIVLLVLQGLWVVSSRPILALTAFTAAGWFGYRFFRLF